MIPESVIEEIRSRIDAVAVIGRHVELKKAGRTWKGCCVFHSERTPSFHVYPDDKHYKCYGCDAYGDVFQFLQRLEGKEFPEVVKALAAEVGVEIPEGPAEDAEAKARRRERNEVLAACDATARYYAARLWSPHGEGARAYLAGRGVSDETAKRFRLGVAAGAWNDLPRRVVEKGVGEPALRRAGLRIEKEDGSAYDRFRGRLMFPICAQDGQVIGFGGRALGEEKGAKYINTPETVLYKKGKVLYGLDLAREHIRRTRSAVLVEGYFDVIGLHQAGFQNAVAVCGTVLTPEHVELLRRCDCREVTVLFDGDSAGLAAPAKAAEALLPSGMSGKVAALPAADGKIDPDEFARREGRRGVEALLASATPLTEHLVDRAIAAAARAPAPATAAPLPPPASLEAKLEALRELEPFLRAAPEGLARTVFEERVAKRLDLDLAALRSELSGERRTAGRAPAGARRGEPQGEREQTRAPPGREATRRVDGRSVAPQAGERAEARPTAPRRATAPVRLHLPGPAIDALGLLAAFPDLAEVAADEDLPGILPPGPLADLARRLGAEPMEPAQVVATVEEAAGATAASRVRELTGPGRPKPEDAARELRRCALKAQIEQVRAEQDRLLALVARSGSPAPTDLAEGQVRLRRRRSDLEKRLRSLERG